MAIKRRDLFKVAAMILRRPHLRSMDLRIIGVSSDLDIWV